MAADAHILNTEVASSSWTPILDQDHMANGQSYLLKMRTGWTFKVSFDAAGATYLTVDGSIMFGDLRLGVSGVIAYVQSSAPSDVCETVVNI